MPIEAIECPVQRITDGPFFHFFGYYEKTPWDASGRYVLGLSAAPVWRSPTIEDMAVVGMVDLQDNNRWIPLAQSLAWNWQQGNMLQWRGVHDDEIIFNTRTDDGFGTCVLNVKTGDTRSIDRPVTALDSRGETGLSLNYARLKWTRPVVGYAVDTIKPHEFIPDNDGIYRIDMSTGESSLLISLAQVAAIEPTESSKTGLHWFNHLVFNPSGTRFAFIHRCRQEDEPRWQSRVFTANADGSDIYLLEDSGYASHFDWRDDGHLFAWSLHEGDLFYFLYEDRTKKCAQNR